MVKRKRRRAIGKRWGMEMRRGKRRDGRWEGG